MEFLGLLIGKTNKQSTPKSTAKFKPALDNFTAKIYVALQGSVLDALRFWKYAKKTTKKKKILVSDLKRIYRTHAIAFESCCELMVLLPRTTPSRTSLLRWLLASSQLGNRSMLVQEN